MVRRTSTQWFSGDDRFLELMHALTHADTPWSYPEQPSVLLALDEIIAWTNDSRQYDERMHKAGWVSSGNDFFVATKSLGTSVTQILKQHLHKMQNIWHDDIGGDIASRARLANEANALRRELSDTATLKAAWQDLRRASGKSESPLGKA